MGLFDFDPETTAALQQLNQPTPEQLAQAKRNSLMNMGLSMMANSYGPRGGGFARALGQGGMAGMEAYQASLDEARKQQMGNLQNGMAISKLLRDNKAEQARQSYLNSDPSIPQEVRAGVIPYSEWWKRQNPEDQYKTVGDALVKVTPKGVDQVYQNRKAPDGFEYGPDGQLRVIPAWLGAKRDIAAAGASRQNVNLPPMESEEQKALGKDLAEQYSTSQKAGMSASGTLNKLRRAEQLMEGLNTGKLAPASAEVAAVAESLGVKLDPKLSQKQAFVALTNEIALRNKNQGGENLMPGAMSEGDRTFLQQMGPSLANTPEGNRLIFESAKRMAQRDIQVAKMAREYRQKNKTLNGFSDELSAWSEKNPLFGDLQKQQPPQFKIIGVR